MTNNFYFVKNINQIINPLKQEGDKIEKFDLLACWPVKPLFVDAGARSRPGSLISSLFFCL